MQRITLTSPAFAQGQPIRPQHTADGRDLSPPLQWSEPPEGTQTWALICDDPDVSMKTWVHWIVFNIPAQTRHLQEGLSSNAQDGGFVQGINDFAFQGYGGPAPPPGRPHRYFFRLYALDTRLDLPANTNSEQLFQAMQGHILGEGELMGTYFR